ncbi:hypothetical protein Sjap_004430 [Stephania japonica]|uniref:Transcription factor n=1 Tax=Stephania japonica TaxID=461633 RepID=A0AAP0K4E2_9MAGN
MTEYRISTPAAAAAASTMNLWMDDNASMMDAFMATTDLSGFNWSAPTPPPQPPPPSPHQPTNNNNYQAHDSHHLPFLNQETLQHRLQSLIEGARETWTYAIFWQYSQDMSGVSLLGWGDGYYKGNIESVESIGTKKMSNISNVAEQEHRKKVLRELNSLISGGALTTDDSIDEEVTDTEWFFLVSMTQSFVNGSGLPGQAFFSSSPVWVAGADRLASCSCERARQAQVFGLQTMVCIALENGVVELGSAELILQSSDLMNKVRVLFNFSDSGSWPPQPPSDHRGENDPSLLWISDPSSSAVEIKDDTTPPRRRRRMAQLFRPLVIVE